MIFDFPSNERGRSPNLITSFLLINLAQSVVRINPGQGQNYELFEGSLVSVKSIEKVTSHRNKSRNIVTGGKSRLYDSKLLVCMEEQY